MTRWSLALGPKLGLYLLVPLLWLLNAVQAAAAEVGYLGVRFPVESLTEVDNQNVRVELFGRSRIVPRARLGAYVAEQYLQRKPVTLTAKQLQQLLPTALTAGDTPIAAAAGVALLRDSHLSDSECWDFFRDLPGEQQLILAEKLLPQLMEVAPRPQAVAWLLYQKSLDNSLWVQRNSIGLVYQVRSELQELYRSGYREALRDDPVAAEVVLGAARDLLGAGNPVYQKMSLARGTFSKIETALDESRIDELSPLVDLVKRESDLVYILGAGLVQLLHAAAATALSEQNPLRSLQYLGLMESHWRNPQTHELALKALKVVKASDFKGVMDGRSGAFLRILAEKDEGIRGVVLELLEAAAYEALALGAGEDAKHLLARMIALSPDPVVRNDRVRAALVLDLQRQEDLDAVSDFLTAIRTPLPLKTRYRFFVAGVYGNPYWLIIGAFVAFLLLLLLLYRLCLPSETEDFITSEGAGVGVSIFARMGMKGVDPRYQDYRRGLKHLGLEADADLAAIKQAYRNAVKEVHPDLQGAQAADDNQEFIELTKIYERLLKLRSEFLLDPKKD